MEAGIAKWRRSGLPVPGDASAMPPLVAVRSGARDSMPGMMDTDFESRPERPDGARARRRDEERAFCVGLLSPFHSDVWRCRARRKRRKAKITSRLKWSSMSSSTRVSRGHRRLETHGRRPGWNSPNASALVKSAHRPCSRNDPWEQPAAAGAVFGLDE